MQRARKWTLTALLMLLGLSLLIPGIIEMFRVDTEGLQTESVCQLNQYRALHGMMAGLGLIACLACWRLESSRHLILGIGITLLLVVTARLYSLVYDGLAGKMTLFYLLVESFMAIIFLLLAPPAPMPEEDVHPDDAVH